MNRFIYTLALALMSLGLSAQEDFFIFIQQPAGHPFYVRIGDKSFSSTAGGHIILSQLRDSVYELNLGFPKSAGPEEGFMVPLHGRDRGFELTTVGAGWQLVDLQTGESFLAASDGPDHGGSAAKRTDSYSLLMAGIVDDSTVLYTGMLTDIEPAPKDSVIVAPAAGKGKPGLKTKVQVKKDTAAVALVKPPAIVKEPAVVKEEATKKDTVADTAPKDTAVTVARPKPSSPGDILRYGSENKEEGKEVIYLDRTMPATDTIRILIPRL